MPGGWGRRVGRGFMIIELKIVPKRRCDEIRRDDWLGSESENVMIQKVRDNVE